MKKLICKRNDDIEALYGSTIENVCHLPRGVFRVLQARATLTDLDRNIRGFLNGPDWCIAGRKILNSLILQRRNRGESNQLYLRSWKALMPH